MVSLLRTSLNMDCLKTIFTLLMHTIRKLDSILHVDMFTNCRNEI